MFPVTRLQAYLRHSAQHNYDAVSVPPFTAFFHPTDDLTFFNYAIPNEAASGDMSAPLAALRAEYAARKRRARFEFIEGFAPDLAPALAAGGFAEESRLHLMVCTPDTFRPALPVPDLAITQLAPDSSPEDIRDVITTQRRGFEGAESEAAGDQEVDAFGRRLSLGGGVFLARIDGVPVAAGSFSAPADGLTEVGGITTLEPYRRRGIGSALTAEAVRVAFESGVEAVVLSAAGERAGRIYERIGFRPTGTMLAYIDES